jgi:hypothetical protein
MIVVTKNRFFHNFLKDLVIFAVFLGAVAAIVLLYINFFSDWKVYRNKALSIEFRYPAELSLVENGGRITLFHQVQYKNNGDCDMMGDERLYNNLTDFQMSFELGSIKDKPEYIDGQYSAGSLRGNYQYYGAEGCGDTNYFFPLGGTMSGRQLVVRRANIQTLSGVRNNTEEREEILTIPGVISKERNDELFRQIISSFKIIE